MHPTLWLEMVEVAEIIGWPLGLATEVLQMANYRLSFSKMTFPRRMMGVILREQIYRRMRIMRKEPYHK